MFSGDALPTKELLLLAPPIEKEIHTGDAPPPPELSVAELARARKVFEEYCQATMDRGTLVAARARCYELPPEIAFEVIRDVYAPRCAALDPPQPWSDENIVHKLEQVYSGILHYDLVFGPNAPRLPPEGFFERLAGHVPPTEPLPLGPEGQPLEDNCARPNGGTEKITLANIVSDLRHHKNWSGVLRFNELARCVTATENSPILLDAQTGPLSDVDYTRIQAWFERRGKRAAREDIIHAVNLVAQESKYNPIRDYLDALPEAKATGSLGTPLSQIALRGFGCSDPLAQEALVKTLIGAVRRIRHPGAKIDTILVLRGKQGIGKSMSLSVLFGPKYVKSQMPDLSSKDACLGLLSFWCVEFAELDRIIRAESSTAKEFISRPIDSFRRPYAREDEQFPRMCIFIGTTNDEEFLVDVTGNRRYWVIEVTWCDLEWLAANRDAIWAEAAALEAEGETHWFKNEATAERLQTPYETTDPWHAAVRDLCCGQERVGTATEIYLEVIAKNDLAALAKLDKKATNRIGGILKRLGCKPKRSNSRCCWEVPENLQLESPSPEEAKRRAGAEAIARMKTKYS
jgi:predicted P-loop ATPase